MNKKQVVFIASFLIFLCVFGLSGYMILLKIFKDYMAVQVYKNLKTIVNDCTATTPLNEFPEENEVFLKEIEIEKKQVVTMDFNTIKESEV